MPLGTRIRTLAAIWVGGLEVVEASPATVAAPRLDILLAVAPSRNESRLGVVLRVTHSLIERPPGVAVAS